MNKMISLAKIMFAGLAVYLLIGIVGNMLMTIHVVTFPGVGWERFGIAAASLCISLVLLAAVVNIFILKRDKWAHKLIAKDIEPDQPLDSQLTLTMAFRLVSVGAGIYCMRTFVWSCSVAIGNLMLAMQYRSGEEEYVRIVSGGFSSEYIQPILYLALAVYLLCGAPHFVRWQVKKTLQFCNETVASN